MTDAAITSFYGLLTFATVAYAHFSGVRGMFGASLVLLTSWVLSALSFHSLQALHPLYYPAIDFVLGSTLVLQGRRAKDPRLYGLSFLFLADLIMHVQYFQSPDHSFNARWNYDLKLNLLYLLQLGYVSSICWLSKRGGTELGKLG